jgi:hypothetical protein
LYCCCFVLLCIVLLLFCTAVLLCTAVHCIAATDFVRDLGSRPLGSFTEEHRYC